MEKLTYVRKKNCLIINCDTHKYYDFFRNICSSVEKECFILKNDKEPQLIKILNYLNFIEQNGKPRFLNIVFYNSEKSQSGDDEYTSSSEELSSSGESLLEANTNVNETDKDDEVDDFFKSFARSDFVQSHNKIISEKEVKNNSSSNKNNSIQKEYDDDEYEEEYSSSSYNSSSSDNFPSPKTPKRRNNFSNEQLYLMIEKLEKKINLIHKVLEKKIL